MSTSVPPGRQCFLQYTVFPRRGEEGNGGPSALFRSVRPPRLTPAAVYPATENYVFTHRPLSREGFTPVCGSVPEFVESLGGDRNIRVVGGNTLLAPLLERDMVDRMIVQIAPVLLGGGVPLFTQGLPLRRFRLDGVRRYGPFAELSYSKA